MNNPHISEFIEIRRVDCEDDIFDVDELQTKKQKSGECDLDSHHEKIFEIGPAPSSVIKVSSGKKKYYRGPPVLVGVVKDGENFDFCMFNPPFFETMEEAGLNPNTACGGTSEEMVCFGGEQAFISRIIGDSVHLKHKFRWFTSMDGRKSNLTILAAELWDNGVTVVKTTVFVQGKTSSWGLAWSFLPASRTTISSQGIEKNNQSFMLEITASREHCDAILKTEKGYKKGDDSFIMSWKRTILQMITTFNQIPCTCIFRNFSKSLEHFWLGEHCTKERAPTQVLSIASETGFCRIKAKLW